MKKLSYLNYLKERFNEWKEVYADEIQILWPVPLFFVGMILAFVDLRWSLIGCLPLLWYAYLLVKMEASDYQDWKEAQKQNEV